MAKYRIKKIGSGKYVWYRVDKRQWFFFIPYWDIGASDMMPNYNFQTIAEAERAILAKAERAFLAKVVKYDKD